jgi:hypothetical protein
MVPSWTEMENKFIKVIGVVQINYLENVKREKKIGQATMSASESESLPPPSPQL